MLSRVLQPWLRLSRRRRAAVVLGVLAVVVCAVAALNYLTDADRAILLDTVNPVYTYLAVFVLIALDAVMPIFPGETTLNAAATAAAQGKLELLPIIVMGALGAIVGDSSLFWIARRYAHKAKPLVDKASANSKVREALAIMDSSAPALIVGGRYVPGMRFVVNGTMGLSQIPYGRFLRWSALSGVLWSTYTSILAYQIGLALGEYPLASFIISGLVTTVALAIIMLNIRRHRRAAARSRAPTEAPYDGPIAHSDSP